MEMKKVVFTAVLALSCSAFADGTVTQSWFELTPASAVSFDRELDDPLSVICPGAPETGVAVYRIIATITDLKVFAAAPDAPAQVSEKTAKASICAVGDKWYYRNGSEWTALESFNDPVEGGTYTIKVEYDGSQVRYKVQKSGESEETSSWITSTSFVPSAFAFAGTGAYSSVVCEYEVTIPDNNEAVTVDNVGGKIIISDTALQAMGVSEGATAEEKSAAVNALGENDLKKWVNYVLGLPNNDANAKPFAAPEQNSTADKLTFSLGGVDNVLGETATGAKVTYTVETLSSVDPTPVVDATATEPTPVDPKSPISVAVPTGVKYYRIKIKIDPAQ